MKNRWPREGWQLVGHSRRGEGHVGGAGHSRTGNVIICYLLQQRTGGCTRLLFLVTATKQISQYGFLLPVRS